MERKLVKQGNNALTITLPKQWIDNKGLKPGSTVKIKETGTALTIDTSIKEKKDIAVEITEHNKQDLKNILTHIYRRGFDTITINNIDKELLEEAKEVTTKLLLGFEITQHTNKKCRIENISEPTEEKYEVMIRRIFLIIKETQKIINTDFKNNKFTNMKEIQGYRDQQDKFILFCRRILTKEKFNIENPSLDWELLTFLMHIEHGYYYLYLYASKNKLQKNKNILELLQFLETYYQLFYDAYYKKDITYVHKINNLRPEYQFGKCYKYLEQAKQKDTVILSHIRELFRLTQIGTSPILSGYFEASFE
ncbi:hypothetical protein KY348_06070 [Candidatus Woesearchaeota archaeon]|nr:hypothetical protein [Candidatus Woesearchaeota archaeon]